MNYKKIRTNLLKKLENNSIAIISASDQKIRSNDTEYIFRQSSNFYYLTGLEEDCSVLVLSKQNGISKSYLFLKDNDKLTTLWLGKSLGVKKAKKTIDVDKVYDIKKYKKRLEKLLVDHNNLYIEQFTNSTYYEDAKNIALSLSNNRAIKQSPRNFLDIATHIETLRLIKDKDEIKVIKKAIDITKKAHHKAMKNISKCSYEYQVQAIYNNTFIKNKAFSDAYSTIVAGGDRANVLHYINNNKKLDKNDLVLIDAGCEYKMYASDITRTFPVNGKFSEAQKDVYNKILDAQKKIIAMIKPGIKRLELQKLSEKLLCTALIELGVLNGSLEYNLKEKTFKKYYPHGIGHWMGLDVHDQAPYFEDDFSDIILKEGMVLTIEPGLYLKKSDKNIPKQYRGIGIRIEDDILVTKDAYENLSLSIVKDVKDIEEIMKA